MCFQYVASLPLVLLDSVNCAGWTPLMYACYLGHRHLVEYLVSRSCDALNENKEGRTPLMLGEDFWIIILHGLYIATVAPSSRGKDPSDAR